MRFLANGPSIPDDLLIARDAGDVIFFCGAGVSRHRAGLPDFIKLGGDVIDLLGPSEKSLARKLFERIREIGVMDGVGGLIATDRIFSLLEREFEQADVRSAVATAIRTADDVDLSAHRTMIDLSQGRDGTVRLVTTNFDLLFEKCVNGIASFGPPMLPNPRSAAFAGIVHLHGRVDAAYAEERKSDRPRMVEAIAARLVSLSPAGLSSIAYPVADWLLGLGGRVFAELAPLLDCIWAPLMAALPLDREDRKRSVDSSWANDALNAPVGKLTSLLAKDPSTKGRDLGQGFPEAWTGKLEELLALPGDMRRHALVMLGFQLTWIFAIAPDWTALHLLPAVADEGDDGDAVWDGLLWAARPPSRALFDHLKPGLLARATSPMRRRAEANVIGAFLLIGWGGEPDADLPEQLITSSELREILVESDDDLRGQILWHLEHWAADPEGRWRIRLVPFLTDVWPNHRALRTPEMSARLADLALASGDLFPQVVAAILPRLVPVRQGALRGFMLKEEQENHPARAYPAAMLDLLWAILAEDASLWPYKVEDVLDWLSDLPETRGDPRLSELRRRRLS